MRASQALGGCLPPHSPTCHVQKLTTDISSNVIHFCTSAVVVTALQNFESAQQQLLHDLIAKAVRMPVGCWVPACMFVHSRLTPLESLASVSCENVFCGCPQGSAGQQKIEISQTINSLGRVEDTTCATLIKLLDPSQTSAVQTIQSQLDSMISSATAVRGTF